MEDIKQMLIRIIATQKAQNQIIATNMLSPEQKEDFTHIDQHINAKLKDLQALIIAFEPSVKQEFN